MPTALKSRKLILFLFVIIFTSCAVQKSQNYGPQKITYLDETGKEISHREFRDRRSNKNEETTKWLYFAPDSGQVSKIVKPVYSTLLVNYPAFKQKIEELTGKRFDKKIFLLGYLYLNDLCGYGNNYNKAAVTKRKNFTSPNKKEIEERNTDIVILYFFEEGIFLANSPDSPEEYFYKDSGNFLRNALFQNPAYCGSYALIKPNGETLVRNGESYAWYIEQHLKDENWELFFPAAE